MSENVKPLPDHQSSNPPSSSDPLSLDTSLMQAAEARMRRALGLADEGQTLRAPDRPEAPSRPAERFPPMHHTHGHHGHAGHKRRFVQDGEVPVTVVSSRRDAPTESAPHRSPSSTGAPSRLEAAETALAHETAARHQAERTLTEAQTTVHDLQTKLGHAELARVEAVESMRRQQETVTALYAELRACQERLHAAEADRAAAERAERVRRDAVPRQAARAALPVGDGGDGGGR